VWGEIADADIDAQGNLWVLHRPPTPGGTAASGGSKGGGDVPLLMFDASRKLVKSFGQGLFLQPHGLHIDPDGNIWVTDSGPFYKPGQVAGKGFQIFKFTRDGKLLMTLGQAGVDVAGHDTFVGPTDVVVNARGEIFVADGHTPRPGRPDGDRIVKLSKDGRFIKAWGTQKGSAPGEVIGPHRLALDSQGRLFVADRGNRRIQIFDQEGRFIDQWTQFGSPSGIWIDKQDTLYVAVPGRDGGVKIGSAKTGALTASIGGTSPEVAVADAQGMVYSGLVGGQDLQQFVRK
jgi:DNA-binding beta-propeller fold protein YncE